MTVVLNNGVTVTLSTVTGTTLTGTYTIGASDTNTNDLTIQTITSSSVSNTTGNSQTLFTVPVSPNNIADTSDIGVDTTPVGSSGSSGGSGGNSTSGGSTRYCTDTITTFCTPRTQTTTAPTTPNLGKPGVCSADLIITQDMRAGARNGRINNYSRTTIAKKEIMREVKILQTHMNRLGFKSGPVDGILGPITDGAIKRMQKFLGTYQDGLVGPITRSLINNSCGE